MNRSVAITTLLRPQIEVMLTHHDQFVRRWARVAIDHLLHHARDGYADERSTLSLALRVCAAGLLSPEVEHPTLAALKLETARFERVG
jgi:hypothetical protein